MVEGGYLNLFVSSRDHPDLESLASLQQLGSLFAGIPDAGRLFQRLEETYIDLFVNSNPRLVAPLYHSCYVGEEHSSGGSLMGEPALEMADRFNEVGLISREDISEPPDHLAFELEYLSFLLEQAINLNHTPMLSVASGFARDFMVPWVTMFCLKLNTVEEDSFYKYIADILIYILNRVTTLSSP